jgi:hypothetical protein
MTIDPLTVWHCQNVGSCQPLSRPLTADLSTADVIPSVLEARRQRAGEPAQGLAARLRRRVVDRIGHRTSWPIAILTRPSQ